ncbi:MAG: CoA pyrophosphatase [Betaproteobacteria bacterium]|nr:CoA pyrophosphatase [Betaproteobacteria bacterium]MSQ89313.1 CoA pyrophosphatase [Betaproteobacteria bacterium]
MTGAHTADWIRRQFGAGPPPATVYGDEGARPDAETLRPASVLVPIVDRDAGLTVLLTRRATHLQDHSGQVSFPGGRVAAHDASPEATALRETHEEIGLDLACIEVLGRMPDYCTRSGYRITPVVGIVTPPFELRPDANEVDEIFEVPLVFVLDPANHQRQSREWQGELRWFFAIPYQQHFIWGATAGMLVNLSHHLSQGRL